MTGEPWNAIRAARIPAAALPALAALRHRTDLRLFRQGDSIWVRWPAVDAAALQAIFPIPEAAFFVPMDGHWRRLHHRLPAAEGPPEGEGQSLASLLFPDPFAVDPPDGSAAKPIAIRVRPGGEPRPASALACLLADLEPWADSATTHELKSVRAARSGDRIVLLGKLLPPARNASRYWGDSLLIPLGMRADPDLPAALLREAIGAASNELVLLDARGAECIPQSAFQPVSRASLRLALSRGGEP